MATYLNFIIAFFLAVPSFFPAQQWESFPMASLTGTWHTTNKKTLIYEEWKAVSPKELTGRSYTIKNADTLISETIRLYRSRGKWRYVPTVKNQNQGKPVTFKQTQMHPQQMVFENAQHDFPQKIEYRLLSPTQLHVTISAGQRKIVFEYVKVL
ncbi:MAG: DUF6265 family protein [Rufibacter sp.]